jgi:hypothetical protein
LAAKNAESSSAFEIDGTVHGAGGVKEIGLDRDRQFRPRLRDAQHRLEITVDRRERVHALEPAEVLFGVHARIGSVNHAPGRGGGLMKSWLSRKEITRGPVPENPADSECPTRGK